MKASTLTGRSPALLPECHSQFSVTYTPPTQTGSWKVPLWINQTALNKNTDIWEFSEDRRAYYVNILQ